MLSRLTASILEFKKNVSYVTQISTNKIFETSIIQKSL